MGDVVTPEEQFLTEVQSAYDRYTAAVLDEGGRSRLRSMRRSVAALVGEVSEINWCARNEGEW